MHGTCRSHCLFWLFTHGLLCCLACTGMPNPFLANGSLPEPLGEDDGAAKTHGLPCLGGEQPATKIHETLFQELNDYRIENGLEPLTYSTRLESVIDDQVYDLWARNYFDHVNPDGLSPADRALEGGFCHGYVGENIAAGQRSIPRVMTAWKESPPHNANMLEPGYAHVGIGSFTAPNGRLYWGQLFAIRRP